MNDLVQEAYYGKLPEFIELEKLYGSIIKKAQKEGVRKCNPNKYPEMKKISQIFCKVFGFKKALLYWEPYAEMNAYTYSMNAFIVFADKAKCIEKTDRGFYDSSKKSVLTVFTSVGLIEAGVTANEMVAIVLHEIGHNFDYSAYHKFNVIFEDIFTLGGATRTVNKYKEKIDDEKEKIYKKSTKDEDEIYANQKRRDRKNKTFDNNITRRLKQMASFNFFRFVDNSLMNVILVSFLPIWNISSLASKKGELFADSFATSYGYGKDLLSGLNRFNEINKKYYTPKSKVRKFFYDLSLLQEEFIISIVDCHGTDMERCQECIEKLKWDLKHNDFSPELKAELVNEINSMTAIYKNYYKFDKNEQIKITKIARRFCSIIFRGKPNIQKFFKRHKV